jgi:hypothetical protein
LPEQGPAARWAESVRRELDEHAEALDAATRSRLNRARQSALMRTEAARPRWPGSARPLRVWLPAGAAAALALAVALHPTMLERGRRRTRAAAAAVEDLELIQQSESLELYEDQEFYAWLDESEPRRAEPAGCSRYGKRPSIRRRPTPRRARSCCCSWPSSATHAGNDVDPIALADQSEGGESPKPRGPRFESIPERGGQAR